jgi:hypothetical protein
VVKRPIEEETELGRKRSEEGGRREFGTNQKANYA